MYQYVRHLRAATFGRVAMIHLASLTLLALSVAPAGATRVSAYWADWEYYYDSAFTHDRVDFTRLTHVQYAFAWNDEHGVLYFTDQHVFAGLGASSFSGGPGNGPAKCSPPFWHPFSTYDNTPHPPICQGWNDHERGFAKSVHDAGAKAILSIGGWTLSHRVSAMLESPTARATFVDHAIQFLVDWNFDGIDLDFEYPGYAPHGGRPIDRPNFTLLLSELRQAMDALEATTGRPYELTAAVSCGPQNATNAYEFAAVSSLLDYVHLMAYDLGGDWDPIAQHNSALFPYAGQLHEGFDADGCREFWATTGQAPAAKIVLGMAHYGRSFAGATAIGDPSGGHDWAHWSGGTETKYYEIAARRQSDPSFRTSYDAEAGTHFGSFDGGGAISFEDTESIALRTQYVLDEGLAGVVIWQLHGGMISRGGSYEYPLLDATLAVLAGNVPEPPGGPSPTATPTPAPTPSPNVPVATPTAVASTPTPTAAPSPGDPAACPEFVQPYAGDPGYAVGDVVTFGGASYRSLHGPNFWAPSAAPQLWEESTCTTGGDTPGSGPGPTPTSTPTPMPPAGGTCVSFVQPYAGDPGYAVGDRVAFEGRGYESLHEPNWWSPSAAPHLWRETSCP